MVDLEGIIMGGFKGLLFLGNFFLDVWLVGVLWEILVGGYLGYEEVVMLFKRVFFFEGFKSEVSDVLFVVFLICVCMNGEMDREFKVYCMVFDDELGSLMFFFFYLF